MEGSRISCRKSTVFNGGPALRPGVSTSGSPLDLYGAALGRDPV